LPRVGASGDEHDKTPHPWLTASSTAAPPAIGFPTSGASLQNPVRRTRAVVYGS
jgi:hypothetical protein